jgi:hypothetical protein
MTDANRERIERGAMAVRAGSQPDTPDAEAVDTIANVLHWLADVRPEFDARAICETAVMHLTSERLEV